jgi:hypothetical protein
MICNEQSNFSKTSQKLEELQMAQIFMNTLNPLPESSVSCGRLLTVYVFACENRKQ